MRVCEVSVEPGEQLPLHHHVLPYSVVTIEPAHVRVIEHDGQIYEPIDGPGSITFREAGQIHELHNLSTSRYVNCVIEIKQPNKETA